MRKVIQVLSNLISAVTNAPMCSTAFNAVDISELCHGTQHIKLSTDLILWYSEAAPIQFEIPWFSEKLTLYNPTELITLQDGFRWPVSSEGDVDRDCLEAGWMDSWIVIGDVCGDPIIADVNKKGTPLYIAPHGIGSWNLELLASCLDSFFAALAKWITVCLKKHHYQLFDEDSNVLQSIENELEIELANTIGKESLSKWLNL